MHTLKSSHTVTRQSIIAVVEIRTNVSGATGFDKRAEQLLTGTFNDFGVPYNKVARYSLTFTGGINQAGVTELLQRLKSAGHTLIVALGSGALQHLCNTRKVLDKYAGSLTWNESLSAWVLPSHHPSVVYVGPKETINSRYDKFDFMYDHIGRAVELVTGVKEFPPTQGHDVPWEFVGSNGRQGEDKTWTGYSHASIDEVSRAESIFSEWLDLLDYHGPDTQPPTRFAIDTESCNLNTFDPMLMLQVYDGEKRMRLTTTCYITYEIQCKTS